MWFKRRSPQQTLPVPYKTGQWMRFSGEYAIGPKNFVAEGMLGNVVPDLYTLCTPGVSVMIQVLGTQQCYGFPWALVVPVPRPSKAAQDEAIARAARAWEIIQEKRAWTGYLTPTLHFVKALDELAMHLRKLPTATDPVHLVGTMRRLQKILHAFSISPWGGPALLLSQKCAAHVRPVNPPADLLAEVSQWVDSMRIENCTRSRRHIIVHCLRRSGTT